MAIKGSVGKSKVEKILSQMDGSKVETQGEKSLQEEVEEMEKQSHEKHWAKFKEMSLKATDTWILRNLLRNINGSYKGEDRHYIRQVLKGALVYCADQREKEERAKFWLEDKPIEEVKENV